MEKREKAMQWFNSLSGLRKAIFASQVYDRKPESLTGREIEKMFTESELYTPLLVSEYIKRNVEQFAEQHGLISNGEQAKAVKEWLNKNHILLK